MDVYKAFILKHIRPEYGAGTPFEYPVLIGSITTIFATFSTLSFIATRNERRRLAEQDATARKEKIFTTVNHMRLLTTPLTPSEQHISKQLEIQRSRIGLLTTPMTFLYNFMQVLQDTIQWLFVTISSHWATRFIVLPLAFIFCVARLFPGDHQKICDQLSLALEYIVWWVMLGILSSIGFGSGMHSGLLFLFPHIMNVALAANECGSTDFPAHLDMWSRDPTPAFTCHSSSTDPARTLTFFAIYAKVITPAMLWGVGTAIGEIPPYLLTRAAALAGLRTADMEEVDEVKANTAGAGDLYQKMKASTLRYVQNYGFWAVLFFSAYPNALFDFCGIACGMSLMPFSTFFTATLIGKALIKVNGQALLMSMAFSPMHLKLALEWASNFFPESWVSRASSSIDLLITTIQEARTTKGVDPSSDKWFYEDLVTLYVNADYLGIMKIVWQYLVFIIIALFVYTSVLQFVVSKQKDLDDEKIADLVRTRINRPVNYGISPIKPLISRSIISDDEKQRRTSQKAEKAQQKINDNFQQELSSIQDSRIVMSPFLNPLRPTTPRLSLKSNSFVAVETLDYSLEIQKPLQELKSTSPVLSAGSVHGKSPFTRPQRTPELSVESGDKSEVAIARRTPSIRRSVAPRRHQTPTVAGEIDNDPFTEQAPQPRRRSVTRRVMGSDDIEIAVPHSRPVSSRRSVAANTPVPGSGMPQSTHDWIAKQRKSIKK